MDVVDSFNLKRPVIRTERMWFSSICCSDLIRQARQWWARGLTVLGAVGLSAFPVIAAQSITLAWNPNTEPDLAGYRLYYGASPRNYTVQLPVAIPDAPATNVTATVSGLTPGRTYFFAVTALTRDGLESGYSTEVRYAVPNPLVPPVVTESLVVSVHPPDVGPPPTATDEVVEVEEQPDPDPDPDPDLEPDIGASSVPRPRLEIIPVGQPVLAFFISFETPANRECELQVSEDLVGWVPLIPFTAASASRRFDFTDLIGIEPLRFYRLLIR